MKAGKLREQIKSGKVDPVTVLQWLDKQPFRRSEFRAWLVNRIDRLK